LKTISKTKNGSNQFGDEITKTSRSATALHNDSHSMNTKMKNSAAISRAENPGVTTPLTGIIVRVYEETCAAPQHYFGAVKCDWDNRNPA